jgi:hypothetical protein
MQDDVVTGNEEACNFFGEVFFSFAVSELGSGHSLNAVLANNGAFVGG